MPNPLRGSLEIYSPRRNTPTVKKSWTSLPSVTAAPSEISLDIERGHDHRTQIGRYFGHHAEPGVEGRTRLMQQHAKSIDCDVATHFCRGQERRLRRHVDE